ncbi:MAG: TadE/TadG family type IV pilus assembly protein [Candidatus Korobacteraceae bacterium]
MRTRFRRLHLGQIRDEQGAAAIEFALALAMLITVIFWIFELSMVIYTYNVLGDAARQGVHYAIIHGNDSSVCSGPQAGCGDTTGANVKAVVAQYAAMAFHNVSGMTVAVSYPDGDSKPPSRVLVKIAYPYVPYILLPGLTPTLHLTAEGRVIY